MTRSPLGAQVASRTCSNTSRGAPPESAARASVGFAASAFNKSAISFEADTPPTRTRSSPKGWGCGNSARVENRSRISEHVRSVWERETEHITSAGDCDVLNPIHRITHGRGIQGLTGIEVPEWTAGCGFNRFQRPGIVAKEQYSTGGRERSGPGLTLSNLGITPDPLSIGHGESQQNFLRVLVRRTLRARGVVCRSLCEWFRLCEKQIAAFESHHKEDPAVWVVRRGKPVRCPFDAGTDLRAFRSRDSARQYRAAGGVDSGGPIDLLYEGCRLQELTVGPIENIEEAVTVCLQQKMADLAVVFKVHEHAGSAHDHHALHHKRSACCPVVLRLVGVGDVPAQVSGASV